MPVKKAANSNDEINEVAAQAKTENARTKAPEPEADYVYFVSAAKEPVSYDFLVANQTIKAQWDERQEHLVWRVPKEIAHRLEQHISFLQGRIVKAR